MKALYYLRVFFISIEFALILIGIAIYIFFGDTLSGYFSKITLNEDGVKWAMLFPIGIAGWTLTEGISVIFPDEKTSKILHEWPEYWKLKAHFDIGVLNTIIYSLPCILIWLTEALKSFNGAWVFFIFTATLSWNALSFYLAKISVKSSLIRAQKNND